MGVRHLVSLVLVLPGIAFGQEFYTLKGHGGPIMDIDVREDQIATASFDNSVGLWDARAPEWFEGHRAAVNTVIFADDDILLSGGDDYDIIQWDLNAGTHRRLTGHQNKVIGLAVREDGLIASASWDGAIGLWRDGEPLWITGHNSGVNAVAFSTDGALLYSASMDGTIRSWDAETGASKAQLVKHGFGVNELIVTDSFLAYGAVDGGTRVLSLETGDAIADFSLDRRPVLALAHDPVRGQMAVGDGEGYIMIIDTKRWRITRDFRATERGPIWALAFSPDGQNVLAGGLDTLAFSWPIATMDAHGKLAGGQEFLADPKTLPNGARQFMRKCSICHTLQPGSARRAGPSLYSVFGRQAGTVSDYSYSNTLQNSAIIWSETTINALFDVGPDAYIPGTKMPMQRIQDPMDRQDLIAFLLEVTDPGFRPEEMAEKQKGAPKP